MMALWNRERSIKNNQASVPAPAESESEPPKEVSIFADSPERKRVPLQQSLKEAENILSGVSSPISQVIQSNQEKLFHAEETAKKSAPHRKRDQKLFFFLTHEELSLFMKQVQESGLTKVAYFVWMLRSQSRKQGNPQFDSELPEICRQLKAELGRQGGMLKMVIKPNQGQRELHPEEWDALIEMYNTVIASKKLVEKTMERINGYLEA